MSQDDLELTLKDEIALSALTGHDRYALEIVKAIEAGGGKKISSNNLYPVLKKLEKRGFASSYWGEEATGELTGAQRRYYKLIGAGFKALQHKAERLDAIGKWQPSMTAQGGAYA